MSNTLKTGVCFCKHLNGHPDSIQLDELYAFAGEMKEIASTFASAGMPGEFHAAAAEVYRRIAGFKDAQEVPSLADVLTALLESE